MYEYQDHGRYFAQIAGGMEELGAAEFTELGAQNVEKAYRGIYFFADKETLYRLNYCSRLASRILAPLKTFDCHSDRYLYNTAVKMEWDEIISVDGTFAIAANVSNSVITHSQYAGQKLKDGIVDYFREKYGKRPNVDTENPDVWLNLHIGNNKALISLDASGGPLHKRGYRKEGVEAPMQETLAAAFIRISQWDGEKPFYDPMCGSGTIIAEAFMHYCRIPAGYMRKKFGVEIFPDFDRALFEKVKNEQNAKRRELPEGLICGGDIDPKAASAARRNLRELPGANAIKWKVGDFENIESLKDHIIITNPPYGIRLGTSDEAAELYTKFGNFLKRRCAGSKAFVYIGNTELIGRMGLKASRRIPLVNGSIEGRLCVYEMYQNY